MTDVAEKAELPVSLRVVRPVLENNLVLSEYARQSYRVTTKSDTQPDDLLNTGYWAHVAKRLPPLTEIRAVCEDGSWMADYIVLNGGANWTKVQKLQEWRLGSSAPMAPVVSGEYSTEWAGPVHKHRVVRIMDGKKEVLKHGFADDFTAQTFLREHLKAIA